MKINAKNETEIGGRRGGKILGKKILLTSLRASQILCCWC